MIRYALAFGGTSLALALENPQSLSLTAETAPGELTVGRQYDRVPDITANFTVPFAGGHLNLRGMATEYQSRVAGVEAEKWGWGAGVSGSLKFAAETLVWSVQGGDGIGRYMFQTLFQGGAQVGDDIQLWRAVAYHVGLTHAWTPTLRSNLIWTQTFFDSDAELEAISGEFANKRIDVAFVNSFYSPVKNFEIGLEYAWGRRTIFGSQVVDGNDTGTQHRANALARYTFF
jgi:hypothetical protein